MQLILLWCLLVVGAETAAEQRIVGRRLLVLIVLARATTKERIRIVLLILAVAEQRETAGIGVVILTGAE